MNTHPHRTHAFHFQKTTAKRGTCRSIDLMLVLTLLTLVDVYAERVTGALLIQERWSICIPVKG